MKQIIRALMVLLFGAANVQAENVIQAVPLQTTAGVISDEGECIAFEMTNEEENIIALSFMVKLPDGMSFDGSDLDNLPPFELVLDRLPYTGRGNNKQYQHSVNCNPIEDGWWMVTVSSSALNPIKGLSGVILQGYYETDASMQPGVYPILMKDIKLAISGTQKAEGSAEAVSYVTIGETSPLQTEANVNLSTLTGYMPSFVVESLNEELAANDNLSSLNLSGVTELGAELAVPENVVYAVGSTGGLKRTFDAGKKSTVCLPFGLDAAQVAAIKDGGCEVEKLKSYHADKGIVSFEPVTEMEANTPYLVKSKTAKAVFDGMEGVTITDFQPTIDVTAEGGLSMIGSFERKTISSDENISYYAYDAADGSFVRIGKNATVYPFRAYLALSGTAPARLYIGDDDTTGIDVSRQASLDGDTFNLQGMKVNTVEKGIYIKNHKKYIGK